jgi:hypothetical protein
MHQITALFERIDAGKESTCEAPGSWRGLADLQPLIPFERIDLHCKTQRESERSIA